MRKMATVYWTEWGCGFSRTLPSRKAAKAFVKALNIKSRYWRIV